MSIEQPGRVGLTPDQKYVAELERQCDALKAALGEIAEAQQKTLAMIRREGFVFETPLQESTGWEKLAFTLYSTICEIDVEARQALAELEEK